MKFEDKSLINRVGYQVILLAALILACRLTNGLATFLLVTVGIWASAKPHKLNIALACYVIIPLFAVLNPYVVSIGGKGIIILRLGFLAMTVLLVKSSIVRKGKESIPLGMLWLYIVAAVFASIGGYHPLISFLKIVNFALFILGFSIGLQNLDKFHTELLSLRVTLLAISTIVLLGSLATLAFPGIAYFHSLETYIRVGGIEAANEIMRASSGMSGLFCGITNHSQCMGPLAVMTISWVLCDMICVEKRISLLHLILIFSGVPLVYFTRSRTALLAMIISIITIYSFGLKVVALPPDLKLQMRLWFRRFVIILIIVATIMEARSYTFSKWARKTDDVIGDTRSFQEAFTSSRQGAVRENMRDFKRNPLFGSGFQVAYDFPYRYRQDQFVLSAPIEKGVLPLMILGETGIVGGLFFIVFLIVFYNTCVKRKYAVTATLFTVFMALNLGEAIFFSTGAAGGILWVMSMVGGFTIDMILKNARNEEDTLASSNVVIPLQWHLH